MADEAVNPGQEQPDFEAVAAEAAQGQAPEPPDAAEPESEAGMSAEDASAMAESLLAQVHAAVSDANAVSGSGPAGKGQSPPPPPAGSKPIRLPTFDGEAPRPMPAELDLLADVNLYVKIELGRTRMLVEDVLKLSDGAVVELDKLAGDPVDIYVNERHVARGEVLVLNDNFCVRINEIVDPEERKVG